jgi:hypothetical protein
VARGEKAASIKLPKLSVEDQIRVAGLPTSDELKALAGKNERSLMPYHKGRNSLTIITQIAVLEAIERGHNMHIAGAMAGVTPTTIKNWLTRGMTEDATTPHGKFAIEYRRAEGRSQEILLERIADTGRDDWRAYAWLLSRRYREWSDNPKASLEQQEEMHQLKLDKAKAEIQLIKAKTERILNQDGDPLQELLGILSSSPDTLADSE